MGTVCRTALPILAGAAFFFQLTDEVAYQDTASLLTLGIDQDERWRVHISAPPVKSEHKAVGSYLENALAPKSDKSDYDVRVPSDGSDLSGILDEDRTTGATSIVRASLTGAATVVAEGYPTVNRDGKADFMMSRASAGALIRRPETSSGQFRRFGADLFDKAVEDERHSSFIAPDSPAGASTETMLAMLPNTYSDFATGGMKTEAAGKTMLAGLPTVSDAAKDATFIPVVYAALLPTPNLPKTYRDAENAIAALRRDPDGTGSWKDGSDAGVRFSKRDLHCLATAVYFEARGESHEGQLAVAQVIINRANSRHWPNSICGVVYQNKRWRNRCQFSFACDGRSDKIRDRKSWARSRAVAEKFANGYVMDGISRATHYHATYVRPRWARYFNKIERVGTHIFYRSRTGGWS